MGLFGKVNIEVVRTLVIVCSALMVTACSDSANKDFNFLEAEQPSGSNSPCAVSGVFPEGETVRVSGSASGKTAISVNSNNPTCKVEYYINGNKISSLSGNSVEIPSSLLAAGTNKLEARLTGEKLSSTQPTSHTWDLVKNSVPVCGTQTPAASGNVTGVGGRFDMSAPLTDTDGDTLTSSWFLNGEPAGTAVNSAITSNVLNAYIVTTSGQQGSLTLKSVVTDGIDSAECAWNLAVNQQCAFSAFSPTPNVVSGEVRVSNVGSTQTQFVAVANSPSCVINWTLNGAPIGTPASILTMLSSNLNAGTNALRATMSDGTTTAIKDWTIRKNTAPSCASQTPAASGVTFTIGTSNLLTATATDAESDNLGWTWTLNGSAAPAGVFVSASANTTSLTTFNTLMGTVSTGLNTVTATINDGYDTSTCSWGINVTNGCSISSTTPSGATAKVAAANSTSTAFVVNASDAGCPITWSLNGAPLVGTSATRVVQSSALAPGGNTLVATTTNGSKTWFVSRNIPPTCGVQSPGTTNNTLGVGLTSAFNISPSDTDDPVGPFTYAWKLNGLTVPVQISTSTNGPTTQGTASFTPIAAQTGNSVLAVDVNDSYDSTTCSWQMAVQPACAATTSSPSSATAKVSAIGSTINQFVVSPNDASCAVDWKINGGATIANGTSVNVASSQLNSGANTLTATISNSTSTATRTWTLTKNVAPTCSGQTPASSGTIFGVSQTQDFTAVAGNTDGDTITFAWTVNGNTVPGAILSPTYPTPTSSVGLFIPNVSYVGANSLIANISDGIDSAACTWSVSVRPDCAVSSSIPAGATSKMSTASGVSGTFGVVPNDSSCLVNWTLNGNSVATGLQFLNLQSTTLDPGSNDLVATISNGTSQVTRTWTVTRNRAPVCASQTPATTSPVLIDVGNYGDYSAVITDQDADSYTVTWMLDAVAAPTLFSNVLGNPTTNTYAARFSPGVAQVGQGKSVGIQAFDGYDTVICPWVTNVNDPNTVSIQACLPAGNPIVVTSAGTNSSRDFTVSATGTGLSYKWRLNGSYMVGQTAPNQTFNAAGLAVGNHVVIAEVVDTYANQVSCTFNVKRNAPPVISNPSPLLGGLYRVNYANTIPMAVTATDANGDMLEYTWTLDSVVNTNYLPTGASTTTFDPKSDVNVLGAHTVSVAVNDGNETTSYTWPIQVTTFSNQCNTIMNGPTSGASSTGGQICTLVGYPGAGHDLDPLTVDPSVIRIRPTKIVEDELNNPIIADDMSHVVWYYNKLGYAVTKFNQTIPAGKMRAILGAGSNGNSNVSNTTVGGTAGLLYKLSSPHSLTYDLEGKVLYIADYNNHRVLSLPDSTDYPQLFLGGTANNSAAFNTANNWGRNHGCANPADLAFKGTGANRVVYVACYQSSAIKVVNADINDSGNYSRADILVGRMPTANYNGNNYTGGTTIGGFSTGTYGRTGDAELIGPFAMTIDPLGRLYVWGQSHWAPYPVARNYNNFRTYVVNTGSTAFTALPNGSVSWIENFWADDITTTAPVSIVGRSVITSSNSTGTIRATAATLSASPTSTLHSMMISGPDIIPPNTCMPYLVTARFNGLAGRVAAAATVNLTSDVVGTTFFSNSNCSTPITSVNFSVGQSSQMFYASVTTDGIGQFTATATNFSPGNLAVSVVTAGTSHNTMRVVIPNTMHYSDCVPFTVQAFSGTTTPQTVSTDRTIRLLGDGQATFYADSACATNPITRVTMLAGTGLITIYTSRKVNVQPGTMGVLLGSILTDPGGGGNRYGFGYIVNPTAGVPDAGLFLNWTTHGIEIDWNTAGNTLRGLFLSVWDHHRIMYLNLSGSTISFGNVGATAVSVENGDVGPVIDYNGNCGFLSNTNGVSTRVCNPRKITASNDRSKLYIADYSNGRVQTADLSLLSSGGGPNALATSLELGTGYFRYLNGNFNDAATASVDARMNRPFRGTVDSEANRFYFTDQAYCRVRYLDLLSGMVQTVASRGCADQTFTDDALTVYSRDVKDVQVFSTGGSKWLLYSDNNNHGNNTANTMSQIRAVNLGLTSATIYGQTFAGSQAGTVVGNFSAGTGAWNTGSPLNSDGAAATSVRLFNPDGFAIDPNSGTMYISLRDDNCIVKVTSAGVISQFINNCTVTRPGAAVDGPARDILNNPVANVRHPAKIVMDPVYPASGNFFFSDFVDTGSSRVRYVNFLTSAVPFGNVTATAGTSINPTVTTIFTIPSPGTGGWTMGLAAFDRQICVSNGYWNTDGNNSPHNVICKDRYNVNFSSNTSLVVGPDASVSVMRGGSPLGLEQEAVAASAATLLGPTDVSFDSSGNLYIIEAGNHLVRFVRRWW